jgi:hypothetical protein
MQPYMYAALTDSHQPQSTADHPGIAACPLVGAPALLITALQLPDTSPPQLSSQQSHGNEITLFRCAVSTLLTISGATTISA